MATVTVTINHSQLSINKTNEAMSRFAYAMPNIETGDNREANF